MTITFDVTQNHIDKGQAGKCDRCPIALALLDWGCDEVFITSDKIEARIDKYCYIGEPNHKIMLFIGLFDDRHYADVVRPGTFTLDMRQY